MVQTSLQDWSDFESRELTGRNRRLLHEWRALDRTVEHRDGIDYRITKRNAQGLPTDLA